MPSSYTESSVKSYVDTRFSAATSYADAAKATLNDFLGSLSSAISGFTGTPIDFGGVVIPAAYTPPTITLPAIPSFPTTPTLPALAVKPAEVVTSFDEITDVSGVKVNLESALNTALTSGKLLSSSAEQALYDRALGRTEVENAKIEDNAMNLWASRGFEVPSDTLLAIIAQSTSEQTRNNLEISAEVLAKSGELAMQGTSAVLNAALGHNSAWLQHIDNVNQRALQLKLSNVENSIKVFQIEAQQILGDMQSLIALYQADSQKFATVVGAVIDVEKLELAGNENAIKAVEIQRDLIIKQAETQLRESANLLNIQLESLKAGAQVNAQIVASALSSYSSNISYGFSGGWNDNYSTDNTKDIVSEQIVHNLTT